jgi:fatty-acyl-CoA synthase
MNCGRFCMNRATRSQFIVAFYAVMRADAVVVPVNPMNKADEFGHYISDPDTQVVITSADLAGIVAQADAALPPQQRLRALLVSQLADYLPPAIPDDLQPAPAIARWLTTAVALPEGATAWADALVAGEAARAGLGPCSAGPDDLALLPSTRSAR